MSSAPSTIVQGKCKLERIIKMTYFEGSDFVWLHSIRYMHHSYRGIHRTRHCCITSIPHPRSEECIPQYTPPPLALLSIRVVVVRRALLVFFDSSTQGRFHIQKWKKRWSPHLWELARQRKWAHVEVWSWWRRQERKIQEAYPVHRWVQPTSRYRT